MREETFVDEPGRVPITLPSELQKGQCNTAHLLCSAHNNSSISLPLYVRSLSSRMPVAACLVTSAMAMHHRERNWGTFWVGLARWSFPSHLLTPTTGLPLLARLLMAEPLLGVEGRTKHSLYINTAGTFDLAFESDLSSMRGDSHKTYVWFLWRRLTCFGGTSKS